MMLFLPIKAAEKVFAQANVSQEAYARAVRRLKDYYQ